MVDEKTLIQRYLKSRFEDDFNALYELCNDSLYRLSVYLCRQDEASAYDLLQETWITGLRQLAGFRGESGLKSWLTGILINKSRNHFRKERSFEPLSENADHADEEIAHLSKMDLDYALKHIPQGYSEVLLLHDLEGYKHREIGEILHITEGTSKSQLSRARKAVRQIIKAYQNEY